MRGYRLDIHTVSTGTGLSEVVHLVVDTGNSKCVVTAVVKRSVPTCRMVPWFLNGLHGTGGGNGKVSVNVMTPFATVPENVPL